MVFVGMAPTQQVYMLYMEPIKQFLCLVHVTFRITIYNHCVENMLMLIHKQCHNTFALIRITYDEYSQTKILIIFNIELSHHHHMYELSNLEKRKRSFLSLLK